MKLAVISTGFPPHPSSGGIGRYYAELVRELKKKIEEVHVIAPNPFEHSSNENVFFHRIEAGRTFFPFANSYKKCLDYSRNALAVIKKINPDIVQAPIAYIPAYYAAKKKIASIVSDVVSPLSFSLRKKHFGVDTLAFDRKLVFRAEKFILENSNAVIANSFYTKKEIIEPYYGIKKSIQVNQGINTEKFKPKKNPESSFSKNLPEPIVLFVGRVEPKKGLKVLVEAIPLIKEKAHFLVAGSGAEENFSYFSEIKKTILEKKIKNISFLGFVPEEKLADLYNSAEIVVVPSFAETVCYVLLEAMSCAKPAIASSIGGMKEIALKELQFEAGNSAELAKKINWLLGENKKRKSLARKSREKIIKEHSIKDSARQYMGVYNSLI